LGAGGEGRGSHRGRGSGPGHCESGPGEDLPALRARGSDGTSRQLRPWTVDRARAGPAARRDRDGREHAGQGRRLHRHAAAAPRPEKDVDGFGPLNAGALFTGRKGLRPCTPVGILRLLDEAQTKLAGARALVVGRSNIVGKPVALLLLERHATVTLAHSRTADLAAAVGMADVVVAAVGKAEMIRDAWVKPSA